MKNSTGAPFYLKAKTFLQTVIQQRRNMLNPDYLFVTGPNSRVINLDQIENSITSDYNDDRSMAELLIKRSRIFMDIIPPQNDISISTLVGMIADAKKIVRRRSK